MKPCTSRRAQRPKTRKPKGTAPPRARVSQVARIEKHLEKAILSGRLRPGQKISETGLARTLGASRTPVREAVRVLVAKGLLVAYHGRGTMVPALEAERVSEVLAIRSCLESFALKLAIPRMKEADIARLGAAYEAMEAARHKGDIAAFEEHDEALHRTVLEVAGSRTLVSVVESLSKQIRTMRGALLTLPGELEMSQQFHRALIDAIMAGDVERAVRLREGALEVDEQKLVAELQGGAGAPSSRQPYGSSAKGEGGGLARDDQDVGARPRNDRLKRVK